MTEAEWLISEDPSLMLSWLTDSQRSSGTGVRTSPPIPSDRKLRLFACAAERLRPDGRVDEDGFIGRVEDRIEQGQPFALGWFDPDHPAHWSPGMPDAMAAAQRAIDTSPAQQAKEADLLREIVGNPYRPVVLPVACQRCGKVDGRTRETVNDGTVCAEGSAFVVAQCSGAIRCPWLETPTVLSLAQAAYDGDVCQACDGDGWQVAIPLQQGASLKHPCNHCGGKGSVYRGALDPVRLAILADALEEAGCPTDEAVKEFMDCPDCGGSGELYGNYFAEDGMEQCDRCSGGGIIAADVLRPHPLLSHLRSPGPHVRGCWILDLLLGKS